MEEKKTYLISISYLTILSDSATILVLWKIGQKHPSITQRLKCTWQGFYKENFDTESLIYSQH